ncbi:MAG: anaerobic sulfatase maturase [Acidobacteria bacterium]|nr:anaerobic sulfatase maturase [Acidobacteriota bacterium]
MPEPFHVMAKPSGPICNLDCEYCFYLEKERLYPDTSNFAMKDDVLESFVRQHIEAHGEHPVVSFAWQGGEPTLLGVEFFERVVALQSKYADGRRIDNALQTNGILIDESWCQFLAAHKFLVGLSIDGPAHVHDLYRRDRGGKPTFGAVMRARDLLVRHQVEFNTLTVVSAGNVDHALEIYRFLREIGSGYMQFIPVVERTAEVPTDAELSLVEPGARIRAQVTPWSVDPAAYGEFLVAVFDEWVHHDVGKVFVQHFDVALESWSGLEASLCVFRETCGKALALEHNGDVYSCDHFVYPQHRLGNLMTASLATLVESPQQEAFGDAKRDSLPIECRECDVRFACHGECPKHRFVTSRDGSRDLNYLCAAYKRLFHHIDPHMRFMANELQHKRAPAHVMAWVAAGERDAAMQQAGRNDPCPCGSGKKFKKCCGA